MARNLRWKICSVGYAIKDCHLLSTIYCLAISYFLLGTSPPSCEEVPFCFASSLSSFASSPSFLHPSPSYQTKNSDVFPKMSIVFWKSPTFFRKSPTLFCIPSEDSLFFWEYRELWCLYSWKNTQCFWLLLDNSYFCNYHFLTFSLWLLQEWKNYMISDLLSCEDLV